MCANDWRRKKEEVSLRLLLIADQTKKVVYGVDGEHVLIVHALVYGTPSTPWPRKKKKLPLSFASF